MQKCAICHGENGVNPAAGYLPLEASIADFAFSACYKWLLGVTGVAVAYWNRARQPGWSPASAARMKTA